VGVCVPSQQSEGSGNANQSKNEGGHFLSPKEVADTEKQRRDND
jgi:hypothetical protein